MASALQPQSQQILLQTGHSVANGNDELTPRKRARKQQLSEYGPQSAKKFQLNMEIAIQNEQPVIVGLPPNDSDMNDLHQNAATGADAATGTDTANVANNLTNNDPNNENSPPKNAECQFKRPKACSLLDVSILWQTLFPSSNAD